MRTISPYRPHIRKIVTWIHEEQQGRWNRETRRKLREQYPYHARQGCKYEIWLAEIARQFAAGRTRWNARRRRAKALRSQLALPFEEPAPNERSEEG